MATDDSKSQAENKSLLSDSSESHLTEGTETTQAVESVNWAAKIDAMDAYLNQVAQLMNDGEMPVAEISKIKFFCSECLESIASEAMQVLGGAGYLRGNPVERIYREVKVMAMGGGSKEIMKDLTAKQLGL